MQFLAQQLINLVQLLNDNHHVRKAKINAFLELRIVPDEHFCRLKHTQDVDFDHIQRALFFIYNDSSIDKNSAAATTTKNVQKFQSFAP